MFIYVIVCSESLKLYIGQHKGQDLGKYLSRKFYDARRFESQSRGFSSHLYKAMRKYPRDSWSIWPLVSGIVFQPELDELEKHFIRFLKAQHSDVGYNIRPGGRGVVAVAPDLSSSVRNLWQDPEYREMQRRARESRYASPEFHNLVVSMGEKGREAQALTGYAKRTEAIRRKYKTPEMRQKMVEISAIGHSNPDTKSKRVAAIKQAWANPDLRAATSEQMKQEWAKPGIREKRSAALTGKRWSEERKAAGGHSPSAETRAKISAANTGHIKSDETRAKLSAAHKGKPKPPRSEEHQRRLNESNKGKHSKPWSEERRSRQCGKKPSEATRAKQSAALAGVPWSAARRAAWERNKGT
jgi:NUMOD3 motif